MYLSNPLLFICANLFLLKYSLFRKAGNYIITQNFGGEEGIRTPIDRLCSSKTTQQYSTSQYSSILGSLDWNDYDRWLQSTRNKLYARKIFNYSKRFANLGFTEELVSMEPS